VKLLFKSWAWLWLALEVANFAVPGAADESKGLVGAELQRLASHSAKRETWPALKRYAVGARDPEGRGLAYLILGYREHEARLYLNATDALRQAAVTEFSLADFAEYYRAEAAEKADKDSEVIEAVQDFSTRHPNSSLRFRALELLARAFLRTGQPARALEALTAEPRARRIASLALLLGQAYAKAQQFADAARAFQEIYYAYPTSPEASAASDALRELRTLLGPGLPEAAEEIQTARAEILFGKSEFKKAEVQYEWLLREHQGSPLAGRWKLGRARCLLSLKQTLSAIEALEGLVSTLPDLDAERLAMLVEAAARQGDDELMRRELDRLRELYPQSPSYALALSAAASFYARRGDRPNALQYDRLLADHFPAADLGREAHWRVAWAAYLARDGDQARAALLEHLTRYPASPHVPGALYWLARLDEEQRQVNEARTLYQFLVEHFAASYHALLARRRLHALPPSGGAPGSAEAKQGPPSKPPEGPPAGPPAELAALEVVRSRATPPAAQPCPPTQPSEAARPGLLLRAVGLDDLAEEYFEGELKNRPDDPELLLELGRLNAAQRNTAVALETAKKIVPNVSQRAFGELSQEIWGLLFPMALRRLVEREARRSGLSAYLVMAVIRQESEFNPSATSWANARGLMQILPQTAGTTPRAQRLAARRLYDPAYNVRFGCRYLRDLLRGYGGDPEKAMAAYHAGNPNVRAWLEAHSFSEPGEFVEAIPITATRVYVEAVMRDAEIYRQLMTGVAKFKKCS